MLCANFYTWAYALILLILLKAEANFVDITYVESAIPKGAGRRVVQQHNNLSSSKEHPFRFFQTNGYRSSLQRSQSLACRDGRTTCKGNEQGRKFIISRITFVGCALGRKDISGAEHIKAFYNDVVTTHGSTKNLPLCTSMIEPGMASIIKNILVPTVADRHGSWHDCKLDIKLCSSAQLQIMQGFRLEFLNAVTGLGTPSSRGLFINSCYAHCQSEMQETWFLPNSPMLDKIPIAVAVGDWFYNRSAIQKIDCPYPCDSTCHNTVFEDKSEA
ncbi:Pectinacetylesterase [Musa troglodytarum]|uniref:Pectin acetylesterase n=1 Tax=Musa troglodytarum TaxID=320322 RepID=A0A9E7FJ53_9LILI|nr:Pectinacetylesterase [Musa troglodytarum]